MKQSVKRFYGLLIAVAVVSGIAGAGAFSLASKAVEGNTQTSVENNKQDDFLIQASNPMSATQPVDLTEAAEKACNAVVYIKVVIGGKTQTIEYRDPFEDFFGDFFGRGNGLRE